MIMNPVGWIGLGAMGLPMVRRLLAAGVEVWVCGHRNPVPVDDAVAAGAAAVSTGRAVAERSCTVFSMVRDEAETDLVMHGPDGVLAGLTPGSTVVVMSTLSPGYCQRLAKICRDVGVSFLDAPVSGGAPRAASGSLSIMVGGDDSVLEACLPLLRHLGDPVFHLGPVGSGQIAKIVNNAIKIGILGLTTEGLAVGVRSGVRLDALLDVLRASSARSHVVEHWEYYHGFKRQHRPGGRLEMLYKDIGFALELAQEAGIDVPLIRTASTVDVGRVPEDDRSSL